MNYLKDTLKEVYHLKNAAKYFGTKNPICKSGWEKQIFNLLDLSPNVVKWGYECLQVPYYNPAKGSQSIYFPDIYCHVKQVSGEIKQFLLEIKPYKFTIPPVSPKPPKTMNANTLKKYEKAIARCQTDKVNYAVNLSKWQQAKAWCLRHNIEFQLVTEKNYNF